MKRETIRQQIKQQRLNLSDSFKQQTAAQFIQQLIKLSILKQALHIGCYISINGEVDTTTLLQFLLQQKKNIYLPKLQTDQHLIFAHYDENSVVEKNKFGILEPSTTKKIINADQLDIVFVPLVAFDEKGNRLGMGVGYYDRTFAFKNSNPTQKALLIGLAYEFQKVAEIAPEVWDVKLDGVITEKQFYHFS